MKSRAISEDKFSYFLSKGFSGIELIIVLGILAMLSASALPFLGRAISGENLRAEGFVTIDTLRSAWSRAVTNVSDNAHGVYIDSTPNDTKLIRYVGTSYSARELGSEIILPISQAILSMESGGNDINFTRGTGTSSPATILLTHHAGDAMRIRVHRNGLIDPIYE